MLIQLDSEKIEMSHIPYYGEEDKVAVKSNNKLVAIASAMLLVACPVSAQDVKKAIFSPTPEEVVVKAMDLSVEGNTQEGDLRIGLSNEVLNHIYDEKTDTWKYVETTKVKNEG